MVAITSAFTRPNIADGKIRLVTHRSASFSLNLPLGPVPIPAVGANFSVTRVPISQPWLIQRARFLTPIGIIVVPPGETLTCSLGSTLFPPEVSAAAAAAGGLVPITHAPFNPASVFANLVVAGGAGGSVVAAGTVLQFAINQLTNLLLPSLFIDLNIAVIGVGVVAGPVLVEMDLVAGDLTAAA